MTFSWEEIRDVWLGDGHIAHTQEEIVREFNRVERILGRPWIEAKLAPAPGVSMYGPMVTLRIVTDGRLLASVDGVSNADSLFDKLRADRPDAWAELRAVYLVVSGRTDVQLELAPSVTVGNRVRKPDFRVRVGSEPWTYVEVTSPDTSQDQARVQALAQTLCAVLDTVQGEYALEVFLRREPSQQQVSEIQQQIDEICRLDGAQAMELSSGLGTLYLNHAQPGMVILDDHGEPHVPRIGTAQAVAEAGRATRHIAVRVAFSDDRADEFLRKDAKQLPQDAPGLVMIDLSQASGGMRTWRPLLQRRLQPNLHTRVGGICLFESHLRPSPAGESWQVATKLLENQHAKIQPPPWLLSQLKLHESQDDDVMQVTPE